MNTLVVGLLRGDEGKGKITDYFADKHDVVIRYAGGPNAGHSIYRNDKLFVTHLIPSGIFNKKLCIIGRGCVVNLKKLYKEYIDLINFLKDVNDKSFDNPEKEIKALLKLSYCSHVITDEHIEQDTARENAGKGNGSTKQGISPAYRDKYFREGKRVIDILKNNTLLTNEEYQFFKDISINDEEFINTHNTLNYLFEGAQGILLDIDCLYYPNVSSSSVNVGGILGGTGISYHNLMRDFSVTGVVKAYMSSVGVGKFLTELNDNNAKLIRDAGHEYGATTGRPRKVGWLDIPLIRYSIRTTGVDNICLTRLDTLLDAFKNIESKIPICIAYKDIKSNKIIYDADLLNLDNYEPIYEYVDLYDECSLSDKKFVNFINFIEEKLEVNIKYLSIGKNKNNIIIR